MSRACCLVAASLSVFVLSIAAGCDDGAPSKKDAILRLFAEEFVPITPGTDKFPAEYLMGSARGPGAEQPAHRITLKYSFAIAKYEVTQELYEAISGKKPSRWKGPRNSVEMTSWHEANDFCTKVTGELQRLKLIKEDEIIRLPSEAEWEYCCRAGTTTAYSFGDMAEALGEYAWFHGNAKGNDPPVGKKKPNAWGLCDMHGYVWEWCLDAWHDNYKDAPIDGSARNDANAKDRVARGGSWADDAEAARSAFRKKFSAEQRSDALGFRCVKSKKGGKDAR
jgi:formylglycine-generating enzyme required for sulfatase activity